MNAERWSALMASLGLPACDACYDDLVAAYAEPHRHYHTGEHIDAMLRHLDRSIDMAERPAEMELAIWFHDAVYRPFSSKNELRSAEWARDLLLSHNYSETGIQRVFDLIMATLHDGAATTADAQMMVDIDLSILGAPADVYEQFERNVRAEYRWVPGFLYRRKRKALLASFLARPSLYYLEGFRQQFGDSARKNLQRAVTAL